MIKTFPFKINKRLAAGESFYFFSLVLFVGALTEIIFPGLFRLYFNFAFLAAAWLASLIFSLLCTTAKK